MLSRSECAKAATLLMALFPGRLPQASADAWVAEIARHPYPEVLEGIRRHARASPHPNLAELIRAIGEVARERALAIRLDRPALPARTVRDAAAIERSRVWAGVAADCVLGLLRPAEQEAEAARRQAMTAGELAERRRALRAEAGKRTVGGAGDAGEGRGA